MQIFRDADIDPAPLSDKRVAIIGYGNQGRAQALNLKDGGSDVRIGLRPGSASADQVEGAGFAHLTPTDAASWGDVVMLLSPDEHLATIYAEIEPSLAAGTALGFAHGLGIHFGLIAPRADLDIFMVAPKGPGGALRANFVAGTGMAGLFAIAQDASGSARDLALAYGRAIGCGRVGLIETSFREECEADLFNEAAVVWGSVPELVLAGYETLVDAGYSPELAWFECVGELKLLADLIDARGIAGMREAISTTAEFGALAGGKRIVTGETRAEMRRVLAEVQGGGLVREMMADAFSGSPRLEAARTAQSAHPVEAVGARLRGITQPKP